MAHDVELTPAQTLYDLGARRNALTISLTPQQRRVLHLLAVQALSSKEIAERLRLSPSTVDSYIETVRKSLGLSTRAQVVLWVFQHPEALTGRLAERALHQLDCTCDFCGRISTPKAA